MKALLKRNQSHIDDVDTEGSWAVSYGDMITLLMAFFVLFFTFDRGSSSYKGMTEALMQILSGRDASKSQRDKGMTDEMNAKAQGLGREEGKGISKSSRDIAAISGVNKSDSESNGIGDGKMLGHGPEQIAGKGKNVGDGLLDGKLNDGGFDAKVYKVKENLIIDFPGISFFDTAKTALTKDGDKTLRQFAERFLPFAGKFYVGVRAFTDYRKVIQRPEMRFKDNLELSALRSVAAMRTLQSSGIPLSRIKLGGYGELILTDAELAKFPEFASLEKRLGLARKVVLIISPEETL